MFKMTYCDERTVGERDDPKSYLRGATVRFPVGPCLWTGSGMNWGFGWVGGEETAVGMDGGRPRVKGTTSSNSRKSRG